MTDKTIGCVQHDCADCKARDAEIERLQARLDVIEKQEPVAYQFQTLQDGKWHDFLDDWHYQNTVKNGRWPIRALFTAPVAQPAEAQHAQIVDALIQ